MIRIRGSGEVLLVAAIASRRRGHVVVVHVALGAGHRCMSSSQRIVCVERVIEGDHCPVAGVVAGIAGHGETGRGVRRIGGTAPILLVATGAVSRRALKDIADVAGCARKRGVHSRQRIAGVFEMVEFGVHPTVHRVARFARGSEPQAHVIDNRR